MTLEAFALDLRPTSSGSPPGLELDVVLPASLERTFTFPVSPPTWEASVTAKAAIAARASGSLRPPLTVELTPPSGQLSASAAVALTAQPPTPLILLGEAGSSRLELASVTLGAGAELTWDGTKASGGPSAQGALTGGKLVIDASEGDSFITTLLGGGKIESQFALQFAFAPESGLRFQGSGSLELQLPVHLNIGPVDIESIYLIAGISGAKLPIELSAAISGELGPLAASVERLGAIVTIGFPPGGGNVGPAQIDVAFKPPTGVGLSIEAGVVTGGGFLSINTERGEYAGALQLELADIVSVSAVGLISTKNPDGSPGFSLLIIITAEFGSGLELGFGFTLNAVGGLLGLNRMMLPGALMEAVRSDAIETIMFPKNVVANAQRIISDLRAIFPPQQGTFLIGPMAELGWGEPTLVSASLGVIVEIPPGDIAILGDLKVVLPAEELEILRLQVNFAGALEFTKSRLYFFAELYDSHLLFITIAGGMGLLVEWGNEPNFVVSVGGFNPRFVPPPLPFPTPQRIQVNVINESFARIRAEGYFAVTTNTVQFGAHTEMYFGFSALSVEGQTSFDALIQFSPFMFIVELSTSFSVKVFGVGVFGIGLSLAIEGPTPWHIHGSASISLLFFSIEVPVDVTFGEARNTTLAAGAGDADSHRRARQAKQLEGAAAQRLTPARLAACARAHRSRSRAPPGRHVAGQPAYDSARSHARKARQPEAERRQPFHARRHLRRDGESGRAAGTVCACAIRGSRRRHEAVRAGLLAAGQRHRAGSRGESLRVRHGDHARRSLRTDDRGRHARAQAPALLQLPRRFVRALAGRRQRRPQHAIGSARGADPPLRGLSCPRSRNLQHRAPRRQHTDAGGRRDVQQPRRGDPAPRERGRRRTSARRDAARTAAVRGREPVRPIANYSFLPWLRQGIANTITAADGDTSVATRATTKVEVQVEGSPVAGGVALTQTVAQNIALYGPGDIIGIDERAIVRTEPRNWISNFESN